MEEAVARPLVEKFSAETDTRSEDDGRTPNSDAPERGSDDEHDPEGPWSVRGRRGGEGTPATAPEGVDGVSVEGPDAGPGPTVALHVGVESRDLSREEARELRDALSEALTERTEFVHTVGHHRADGAYVVERRGADSSGHSKVFDSFAACRRLYGSLPREFTAEDLSAPDLSGGRRHMLAWHFAEHPAFDCELESRQPLTVAKRGDPATD